MARESRLWPASQRLGWPRCSPRSSANHCGYLRHWRKQPWNIKGQGKQSELEPVVYLQDSGEWAVEGGLKKRRRGRASGREGREEKLKETSGSLKVKIWGHMFCYSLTIPSMHSMYLDYLYLHFCFPTPPHSQTGPLPLHPFSLFVPLSLFYRSFCFVLYWVISANTTF